MTRPKFLWALPLAVAGALLSSDHTAQAQGRRVTPERTLMGISLGRDQLEVIRRFGRPSKVQTVALTVPTEQLPGLGGGGGMSGEGSMMGAPGMGGYPGMPGGGMSSGYPGMPMSGGAAGLAAPGGAGMAGAGSFAPPGLAAPGMGGYPGSGGVPSLPPGSEGGLGMPGMPGAPGGAAGNIPEYSTAILWIYERPNDVRLEFLINEDGRVAQISAAAPAGRQYAPAVTARQVRLGSDFVRVMESYGNPEKHRLLPGLRFYETYYTKNYHAAFTFDTNPKNPRDGMKVVRITIALAD